MKNKTILMFSVFLLIGIMLNVVSAESIGTYKINEEMQITNYCNDGTCTYMNLTSLELPNGTKVNINAAMTQNVQDFNYSYTPTILGTYTFNTCGNPSGSFVCDKDTFEVTPSGNYGNSYIVFSTFVISLIYIFTFFSFFYARNIPLTVLGGMAMIFLGVYTINNGIIIFRDTLTNYISYITIGTGFILSSWALLEQFEVI